MSKYKYWKSREYKIERKFKNAGYPKTERVPLSRNPIGQTSEDVVVPELNLLVDVKSTRGKESIRIEKKDMVKIQNDAKKSEKVGAVVFSFRNDKKSYIIMDLDDLIRFKCFKS